MKNKLFLFAVLIISTIQSQDVPNLIWTDIQRENIKEKFKNPEKHFPVNDSRFLNEVPIYLVQADRFNKEMNANVDFTGKWIMPETTGFQEGYVIGDEGTIGLNAAAIVSNVTINREMARNVVKALAGYAEDSKYSFAVGGRIRTEIDATNQNASNLVFTTASKMSQHVIAMGLVSEILEGDSYYESKKTAINQWFSDAKSFFQECLESKLSYWIFGDWQTFENLTFRTTANTNYLYYDENDNPFISVPDALVGAVNNRDLDLASYLSKYGTYYNDSSARAYAFNYFKLLMKTGIIGNDSEIIDFQRSNDATANNQNKGIGYAWLIANNLGLMAHINEVAVEKGVLPQSEKGKFFEYKEFEGAEDIFQNYTFSPSGSTVAKTIETVVLNLGRYYNNAANGGHLGDRYNVNGELINPVNHTYTNPAFVINSYYQNGKIAAIAKLNSADGYVPYQKYGDTDIGRPHVFKIGWDLGAAVGAVTAFSNKTRIYSTPLEMEVDAGAKTATELNIDDTNIWAKGANVKEVINRVTDVYNYTTSKNLYNFATATPNSFIQPSGTSSTNTAYRVSDFIPVTPNTQYRANYNMRFVAFYNADRNLVAGGNNSFSSTFATIDNVEFVRATFNTSDPNELIQLELGNTVTSFEPYFKGAVISTPVQLASLTNATSLATDANGNIIAGTGGGSASTGFHSNLEITANTALSYTNQTTGSGYRVRNFLDGATDVEITIPNLRLQQDENYLITVDNATATADIIPDTGVTFTGKNQGTNDAVRITDFGSVNIFETATDGVFKVEGDFTWFRNSANILADTNSFVKGSDSNSIGTVTDVTAGDLSITVETTDVRDGANALRIETLATGTFLEARYQLTGATAAPSTISFDYKITGGGGTTTYQIRNNGGANIAGEFALIADGQWHTTTENFDSDGLNAEIRIFANAVTSGPAGKVLLIDDMQVVEQ